MLNTVLEEVGYCSTAASKLSVDDSQIHHASSGPAEILLQDSDLSVNHILGERSWPGQSVHKGRGSRVEQIAQFVCLSDDLGRSQNIFETITYSHIYSRRRYNNRGKDIGMKQDNREDHIPDRE